MRFAFRQSHTRAPEGTTFRRPRAFARFFVLGVVCAAAALAACTERQEGAALTDIDPEREVSTDMSLPKNPRRWAYVSTRVVTDPHDPFAGYRIVVANPFSARMLEERKPVSRGMKLAQYIYEVKADAAGIQPGVLRRVNLLVQDPERYQETGGWGYASFDGDGRPIPIAPKADCIVCHANGPTIQLLIGPAVPTD